MDSVLDPFHTCPTTEASTVCTCKYPKIRIPESIAFFLWQLAIVGDNNLHLVWVDPWKRFELSKFLPQLPSKEAPFTFTTEICNWGVRDGQPIVKIACKHNGMEQEYSIRLTVSSCEISREQMLEILTSPAGILVYRTGFIEEAYRRLRPQICTAAEAYILADTIADKLTTEQITAEAHSFVSTLFPSVG